MNPNLRIVLVPNPDRDKELVRTSAIASALRDLGGEVRCTESIPNFPVCTSEEGAKWADVAIVLGGDGTILRFSGRGYA